MPKLSDSYDDGVAHTGRLAEAYGKRKEPPAKSSTASVKKSSTGSVTSDDTVDKDSVSSKRAKGQESIARCHSKFDRKCAQCWYARHHKSWQ